MRTRGLINIARTTDDKVLNIKIILPKSKIVKKTFNSTEGKSVTLDVELFTWEKLDYVDEIKKSFKL